MFGQAVIGPPGCGKSTYCRGMKEFLTGLKRRVAVCNLDPANDNVPYDCEVDIRELIVLDEVAEHLTLGPNGALIYCMEYLQKNVDWLLTRLELLKSQGIAYVLYDFPGQIELYTHNSCVKNILARLNQDGHRLTTVNLADAHYCTDPAKFVAVVMTSLSSMIQLECPHVNVLSKMDLIEKFGKLPFQTDYFTDVLDLSYLVDLLQDDPFMKKFKDLNVAICDVVERYGLVSFLPLQIEDKKSMAAVLREVDKANGYCFRDMEERQLLTSIYSAQNNVNTCENIIK